MKYLHGPTEKVASLLATFTMVVVMSAANADVVRISSPERGSDPVVLHLQDGMPEAAEPSELLQVFVHLLSALLAPAHHKQLHKSQTH